MAALSEIEKLKARYDENPEGRYFAPLADAYRKTGRLDEAIELVKQGLTKHPDYLSAHIVLGRCFLDKKDDKAAKGTFEGVLRLDSENVIALKSLAEIGERLGDTRSARRTLGKLLQVDPTNSEAEADLKRLGGPLPEGEEAEPEPAPAAEPEPPKLEGFEPTAAQPQAPPTLAHHEPVPPPSVTEAKTAPMPALELERASEPPVMPTAGAKADSGFDLVLDERPDIHEMGRQSRASEALAPPIDFLDKVETAEPGKTAESAKTAEPAKRHTAPPDLELLDVDVAHEAPPPAPPPAPKAAAAPAPAPQREPEPEAPRDLPLIMPEDVTPAEELARPSVKQVAMVSPEPPAPSPAAPAAPLLTETMAELYFKQGLRSEAADVYRRLLAQKPGDPHLLERLAAIERPPESMAASALGQESLGVWLKRVARSSLGGGTAQAAAPEPPAPPEPPTRPEPPEEPPHASAEPAPLPPAPPPAPSPEAKTVEQPAVTGTHGRPSPMDLAFSEDDYVPPPPGEPARPGSDAFTLDRVFGSEPPPAKAPAAPAAPATGASFDEFFGAPAPPPAPAKQPGQGATPPADGDDLTQFSSWLHGLKK